MKMIIMALFAMGLLSGCAHVISQESRELVAPDPQFHKLRETPDAFIGRYVMLGGIIASVKNSQEGGQIEVVQFDLDKTGLPENVGGSGGRFLATTPSFVDEYVYRRGRLVTIVGEVKGKKILPLDEVTYRYPVISMREVYLWKDYDAEKPFPYPPPPPFYDPYYWGHWPDSYWYRPLGPALRDHR